VTWHFRDGGKGEAECLSARGGPDQPFSEATIREKIDSLTSPIFPRLARGLNAVVDGEPGLLETGWRTALAQMLQVSPQ
jgi:hypothetical protein